MREHIYFKFNESQVIRVQNWVTKSNWNYSIKMYFEWTKVKILAQNMSSCEKKNVKFELHETSISVY